MPTSVIGFTFSVNTKGAIMYRKNIIFNFYYATEALSCKGVDDYLPSATSFCSYIK